MGFTKTILEAFKYWIESKFVKTEDLPEQIQSDWNQNDSSQVDYVKNRPFYEKIYYTTLIEEQTINLTSTGNDHAIVGELPWRGTFRVTFDGVVYDDIPMLEDSSGDYAWLTITLDSGEQVEIDVSLSISIPESLIGKHTVKVEQKITEITQLDNKFLPVPIYKGEGEDSVCLNDKSNIASELFAYAEGHGTTASAISSHAEGQSSEASGWASHAEGESSKASGDYSHAEGSSTIASGNSSHAEGEFSEASGDYSHAEGYNTIASGRYSHAEGNATVVKGESQFVYGRYNKKEYDEIIEEYNHTRPSAYGFASSSYTYDKSTGIFTLGEDAARELIGNITDGYWMSRKTGTEMYYVSTYPATIRHLSWTKKYAHIVGNGTSDTDRSNAHTLDWDGVGWFQGGLKVGGTGQDDEAAVEVALKTDIPQVQAQVQSDWNQNDETAVDYVKNRPFYTTDPAKTVILEEQTVTVGSDLFAKCNGSLCFEIGKTYFITFNGVEYERTPWINPDYSNNRCRCIGNGTLNGVVDNSSEDPFLVETYTHGTVYLYVPASGDYTISISEMQTTVHQIDIKYVPHDDTKLNVMNPVGYGSFSMQRKEGSIVGSYSHTEGMGNAASGHSSHAEGLATIAAGDYQHAQGLYNIEDTENKYAHIVGNGGNDGTGTYIRSNAHTLDWDGNAWYAGSVEATSIILSSSTEGSTKKFKITIDDDGVLTATEIV